MDSRYPFDAPSVEPRAGWTPTSVVSRDERTKVDSPIKTLSRTSPKPFTTTPIFVNIYWTALPVVLSRVMAVAQISLEVCGLLSVWLETLFYGMYMCLFFETVFIYVKRNKTLTRVSKIFFGAIVVMFMTATAHIAINLYRVLQAYVWLVGGVGPAAYLGNMERWDTITHDALNAFMTWVGDCLVICRCYIVWNNNPSIVALPITLVIMSIIANSYALYQFSHLGLGTIFSPSLVHWMDTIYALAFVQNIMTTGLLAYRIWQQHRKSQGVVASAISLIPLVRIIIESASIYLLNLLILIILYALDSNGQFIAQEAIVPVCGIVFTLITVRLAMRSSPALMTTQLSVPAINFTRIPPPNIASTDFNTTTSDQSNCSNQREHFGADVGEPRDSDLQSTDKIPLADTMTGWIVDEVNMEKNIFPRTIV